LVLIVVGWLLLAWIVASAEALTRFKATAAPTPTWKFPEALPVAVDVALVVFDALTVKAPPVEVIERPAGIVASAWLLAMLTLTAAATLTLPSEVLAEGVAASPFESPAPAESPLLSAKLRWLLLLLSTLLPLVSLPSLLPSSLGPPDALAMALATLVADAVAVNDTAPVAVMLLSVVAVVWSLATVKLMAAPMAALLPAAVPPEVLVVELLG